LRAGAQGEAKHSNARNFLHGFSWGWPQIDAAGIVSRGQWQFGEAPPF